MSITKNIFTLFLLTSLPFSSYCSQDPDPNNAPAPKKPEETQEYWNLKRTQEKYTKAERDNNLLLQAGSNIGNQAVQGIFNLLSTAGSQSIVEVVKRELDLKYDNYPTKDTKLGRINTSLTILNNALELIPKNTNLAIGQIDTEISSASRDTSLSPQSRTEKVKNLEQEKIQLRIQARKDILELNTMRQDLIKEYRGLTGQSTSSNNDHALDNEQINPSPNGTTTEDTPPSPVADNNDESNREQQPGLLSKLTAAVVPACIGGFNFIADNCGPKTVADWLGAKSTFFAGKEVLVKNTITTAGTLVFAAALYKTYTVFTSDDEEEEEDNFLDTFSYKS